MNMTDKINATNRTAAFKNTMKQSKDVAIANQKGTAVLTALRTAIAQTPLVPGFIKELVAHEKYGDFILGVTINVAAQSFTDNHTIQKAARAANLVGTYDMSNEFNQIEMLIESTLTSLLAPFNDLGDVLEGNDIDD